MQISQFSSGVDTWRMPAASSINGHGLLEEDPVTNFVVLPYYHEDEAMLGTLKHLDRSPSRDRLGWPRGTIRPQKIDSPYTTRSTWLAQTLRGMKVATPSLNWIPLSSTFGHGVSVLASGRPQYLGYATGNLPSWASRGDEWTLLRGHNMILILRSTGNYSFMAK